jgi:hypothetical protein
MVMNIADEIIEQAAKELARQIDQDLLKSLGGPEYQLVLDEGRVFGSRYYTAQPMGWGFYGDGIEWNDMVAWCVKTFGPTTSVAWEPNQRWYVNNAKFWFRDTKDQLLFVLRWS